MRIQPESNLEVWQLQQDLNVWRSENRPPKRIPAEIWEKATKLAKEHGVGLVARALKLDHVCLKRRVQGTDIVPSAPEQAFFELLPGLPLLQGCLVHLEGPRGGRARLEFAPSSPAALATFVRELGL